MKTPAPPPDLQALFTELAKNPARMLEVLRRGEVQHDINYLPWDKIRYKTPPGDLTHEEWWASIRMARNATQRPLPLKTTRGEPFTFSLPDEVLRLADQISGRASGNIAMSEQVTNPNTRDRYVINGLIEEAITSSQLEGASTSRREAKDMIRSGRSPRDRSETMIFNNYQAMQRIREFSHEPLTPELICELHRIVTDGTLDNPGAAGRIQSNPDPSDRVSVYGDQEQILHRPPPVDQLPERLQALCDFANMKSGSDRWMPPVVRAITIHFMMGYDHYFEDGNGRTARALFYWSMLNQNYWLTEYLTISKVLKRAPSQYARSFLLSEQDEGDLTYFHIYHLGVIDRALNELDDYLRRKGQEIQETKAILSSVPGSFNYRQLAILDLAMKDPSATFSAESHAQSHMITRQTAHNDLQDLERRDLLVKTKVGKRFIWLPKPKLSRAVQGSRELPRRQ